MKRNREERLKSSGTHHFLVSPHNREERGEREDYSLCCSIIALALKYYILNLFTLL
jgi:hypothetical protein